MWKNPSTTRSTTKNSNAPFPSLNVFIMCIIPTKLWCVFPQKPKLPTFCNKWLKHLVVKRPLPASGIFDGSTSKPPVSPRLRSRGDLRSKGDNRGEAIEKKLRVPDSFYEIVVVMVKISQNPYIVWVGISIPRHVPNKQPPFGPFLYISTRQGTNMPCRNEVHHVDARRKPCLEENHTLPEMVGAQAPENGWLEDDRFLFGEAYFQGRTISLSSIPA